MRSISSVAAPSKPIAVARPAYDLLSATIRIAGVMFEVEPTGSVDPLVHRAWELSPAADPDNPIVVVEMNDGLVGCGLCSDPRCSHVQALQAMGLVDPPAPTDVASALDDLLDWGPVDMDDDYRWDLDDRIGIGPDPADRLTLIETVDRLATQYRLMDSDLGDLIAHHLGGLVTELRITGARTPAEVLDHLVTIDQDHRDRDYDLAYAQERLAEAEAALDGRWRV